MKKALTIVLVTILAVNMFATAKDLGVKHQLNALQLRSIEQRISRAIDNDPPEWVMEVPPTDLATNYYDYAPGSYNQTTVKVQPNQGGIYVVYHGQDLAGSNRRIWWNYINADGTVADGGNVSTFDMWEGYPGMDIHPDTGNPFVAWHVNFDADTPYENAMAFDQFGTIQSPGLWATAAVTFDNSDTEYLPHPDTDDFIWPQLRIAPSPTAGMSRIHIIYGNSGSVGNPASNVVYAYADADLNTLSDVSLLEWTYATFPELDAFDTADEAQWDRSFASLVVSDDGTKVGYVGHTLGKEGETEGAFVFLNEMYGEGEFEYIHTEDQGDEGQMRYYVDNPELTDANGNVVDVYFTDADSLYVSYVNAGHFTANFINGDDSKIAFVTNMGLQQPDDTYYPALQAVKSTIIDLNTDEFMMSDLTPIRYNDDGTKLLPNYENNMPNTWWDVDEDGEFDDTFEQEGVIYPSMITEYPIYEPTADNGFHYNKTQLTVNKEHNLMAAVWSDGTMPKLAEDNPDDPDLQSWATCPEITIALSKDGGVHWTEPLKMNANPEDISEDTYVGGYVEALDGMIPVFVYPSEQIYDIETDANNDTWGTIHLMFMDEYSYGSEVIDAMPLQGAMMKYMAIKVNFGYVEGNSEGEDVSAPVANLTNYPNPFNPTTTISYSTKTAGNVELAVYNLKGQKVRTLVNEHQNADNHTIEWNGKDNNGNKVASGVYFYKLSTKDEVAVQKMLMLK